MDLIQLLILFKDKNIQRSKNAKNNSRSNNNNPNFFAYPWDV